MGEDPEVLVERLHTAFRLHDEGVALMRQNLRRRHPQESDEEIDRRLHEWLSERPGGRPSA